MYFPLLFVRNMTCSQECVITATNHFLNCPAALNAVLFATAAKNAKKRTGMCFLYVIIRNFHKQECKYLTKLSELDAQTVFPFFI